MDASLFSSSNTLSIPAVCVYAHSRLIPELLLNKAVQQKDWIGWESGSVEAAEQGNLPFPNGHWWQGRNGIARR